MSYKQDSDEDLRDEIYLLREELGSQFSELVSCQNRFSSIADKRLSELNEDFTEKAHHLERLSRSAIIKLEHSEQRELTLVKFNTRWLMVLGVVSLIGILYWVFLGHQIASRRAQLQSITTKLKHTPTIIVSGDDDYIRLVPGSGIMVDKGSPLDGAYAKVDYSYK